MGVGVCGRYFGQPVLDGFAAFGRLYSIWLLGEKPDCTALTCLG